MTTPPVGVERRAGQRFPYHIPVSLRDHANASAGLGFTQNLSSRGVFLFTDMPLTAGSAIELTLKMPSEITLGESMRVRCQGRVLRVEKSADTGLAASRFGVAVCLKDYEYLSETEDLSADFRRISALHSHVEV